MPTLGRDTTKLGSTTFDVLVIGGGIIGVAVAWDAALRGLQVALVEKKDFGSETSAGCFKLIHGGIRYLQHLDFPRVLESIREQYILRKIAPHLVHPLPFLIPCYGRGWKGKEILKLGMMVYELFAWKRNHGLNAYHHLAKHLVLQAEECLKIAPGLRREGLQGGVVFTDCQMSNCERLTFSVAQSAHDAGACLGNYLEVVSLSQSSAVTGGFQQIFVAMVEDVLSRKIIAVKARLVVNATGPWSRHVYSLFQGFPKKEEKFEKSKTVNSGQQIFSKGIQVTLPKLVDKYGVFVESPYLDQGAILSRGPRSYIMTPWRGHSLLGTTDSLWQGNPDNFVISQEEINRFVTEIAAVYHSDLLRPEHVRYSFGGLRPADPAQLSDAMQAGNSPGNAKTYRSNEIIDHALVDDGGEELQLDNFISVVGTKYTTFRSLAQKVVDLLCKKLSVPHRMCRTQHMAIVGGDIGDFSKFLSQKLRGASSRFGFSPHLVKHLVVNYGTKVEDIFEIIQSRPALSDRVSDTSEVIRAEIVYACSQMAVKLSDVVFRRTGLGTLGNPGEEALRVTGEIVAAQLGWSQERLEIEIQETKKRFEIR